MQWRLNTVRGEVNCHGRFYLGVGRVYIGGNRSLISSRSVQARSGESEDLFSEIAFDLHCRDP